MKNISIIILGVFCFCQVATAQTPFPFNTTVALSKPGQLASETTYTLYTTTTPTNGSSFSALGSAINFSQYNMDGIGLNATDRLLYAIAFDGTVTPPIIMDNSKLFRVDADGAYTDLGVLPVTLQGYNATFFGYGYLEFVNATAGAVLNNSFFYTTLAVNANGFAKLLAILSNPTTPLNLNATDIEVYVARVDGLSTLTTTPATPNFYNRLDISNTQVTAAINGFLQTVNNNFNNTAGDINAKLASIVNTNGGFQDIEINPANGNLYTYLSYQDPSPENPPLDVVGFPVMISLAGTSGGTATASPIGSSINEEPHTEIAGLAFDGSGNLFGLFASGQYGQINLSTGAVDNIAASSIPTSSPANPALLSGDLARPIQGTVPVNFGFVNASIKEQTLTVNWQTLSELNNDHFDIEVSVDGVHFTKAGTVLSQASSSTSTPLDYSFSISSSALPIGLMSLGIFGFISLFGFKRRSSKILVSIAIIIAGSGFYACSKSDSVTAPDTKDIYVRITQVDKDGASTHSKIIKAIKD